MQNQVRSLREIKPTFATRSHCRTTLEENNYEKIPSYKDKTIKFTSVLGRTYKLPHDNEYLKKWDGYQSYYKKQPHEVVYLRNIAELINRGRDQEKCGLTLDVLAWMMDKINEKSYGNFMITYGQLLHVHREGDFVNKTSKIFFDEDVDMFASLETFACIGQLENELFTKFGWSMRAFVNNDDYTIFMQMMASCGHVPIEKPAKVNSSLPAIEVYPLAIVDTGNGTKLAKDLWQGVSFAQSMVYPPQCIDLKSAGAKDVLHLQIPHKSIPMLECIYGNWKRPSEKHAGNKFDCSSYKDKEEANVIESSKEKTLTKAPRTIKGPSQKDMNYEQNLSVCSFNYKHYDNTSYGENNFTFTSLSTNETFYLSTNSTYLEKWNGLKSFVTQPGSRVAYLRNTTDLLKRGKQKNCASVLDVLAWIMDKISKRNHVLMAAYNQLIHVHREKGFVNTTTGDYIDDEFDTWANLDTMACIGGELEGDLFAKFGWSARAFINQNGYIVLMQLISSCGHIPKLSAAGKVKSSQPAIALFPLAIIKQSATNDSNTQKTRIILKDLWQGTVFDNTLIYPPKCVHFKSAGRTNPVLLQLPRRSVKILDCLYGNWTKNDHKAAGLGHTCKDDTETI